MVQYFSATERKRDKLPINLKMPFPVDLGTLKYGGSPTRVLNIIQTRLKEIRLTAKVIFSYSNFLGAFRALIWIGKVSG